MWHFGTFQKKSADEMTQPNPGPANDVENVLGILRPPHLSEQI